MHARKTMLAAGVASAITLAVSAAADAMVIDAYFGMNFLGSNYYGGEVQLVDMTYLGGSGVVTQAIPAFPGRLGMPDDGSSGSGSNTYTNGGDGETTRTLGVTIPIDWNIGLSILPTIWITDITVNVIGGGGIWTAHSDYGYEMGIIPLGYGTELSSLLFAPYGDIYGGSIYPESNPIGTFISTSAPAGFEDLLGQAFGDFRFAAAQASPVPVPAAIWLFASGLLGLIGAARRKRRGLGRMK